MGEEILAIETPTHTLAATLCLSNTESTQALVVMFAGSGPIDRNENLPNFSLNVFNTLASSFADAGIASLRYDKRGCGASGGDYITAGHTDFVADAIVVTKYAAQIPSLKHLPIILLGHSEGCVIAPQVAEAINVQGQILLCPFARGLREVLKQQATNRSNEIKALPGVGGTLQRAWIGLRGGVPKIQNKFLSRIDNSTTDTVSIGKATINARWFREMFTLDVPALLSRIITPTYALGGGKDVQCDPSDTTVLNQLIKNAPIETYVEKDLTHILRCDDQNPGMGRYAALAKRPIEALVAQRCVDWIQALPTQ